MIYRCQTCHKKFDLDASPTLDELKELRLVFLRDQFWHKSCAKLSRVDDKFILEDNYEGRLHRI